MNQTTITKDVAAKQLTVVRDFNAPIDQVWRAWTEQELLDQWWAPKPWKANTKSMEFQEGGTWLYAMQGPEGEKHWARSDFETIDQGKGYTYRDAFCDENGDLNSDMPTTYWNVSFSTAGDATRVTVLLSFDSEASLDKIIETGFKEGFTAGHGNLDELLAKGVQH